MYFSQRLSEVTWKEKKKKLTGQLKANLYIDTQRICSWANLLTTGDDILTS